MLQVLIFISLIILAQIISRIYMKDIYNSVGELLDSDEDRLDRYMIYIKAFYPDAEDMELFEVLASDRELQVVLDRFAKTFILAEIECVFQFFILRIVQKRYPSLKINYFKYCSPVYCSKAVKRYEKDMIEFNLTH